MMDTFSCLFDVVKKLAKESIEQNPNFDGLKTWKLIEEKLLSFEQTTCEVKYSWILPDYIKEYILSKLATVENMLDKPPTSTRENDM